MTFTLLLRPSMGELDMACISAATAQKEGAEQGPEPQRMRGYHWVLHHASQHFQGTVDQLSGIDKTAHRLER